MAAILLDDALLNARILVQELEGYKIVGAVLTVEKDKWGFVAQKKVGGKLQKKTVWIMKDEEGTGMGDLHYQEGLR